MIDCSYEINPYALFFGVIYIFQVIFVIWDIFDSYGVIETKLQFLICLTPIAIPVFFIKRFMELK